MNRDVKIGLGVLAGTLVVASFVHVPKTEVEQVVVGDVSSIEAEQQLHSEQTSRQDTDNPETQTIETSTLGEEQATINIEIDNSLTIIEPEPASITEEHWYVSSHHSSKFYYHKSCDGWQGLSERYLRSFATEADLNDSVFGRTLHPECNPW